MGKTSPIHLKYLVSACSIVRFLSENVNSPFRRRSKHPSSRGYHSSVPRVCFASQTLEKMKFDEGPVIASEFVYHAAPSSHPANGGRDECILNEESSKGMKDIATQYNSGDQYRSNTVSYPVVINPYGSWEHKRVVVSPQPVDEFPVYEHVKPKTFLGAAKDFLSKLFEVVPEDSENKPHATAFRVVRPLEEHTTPFQPHYRPIVYVVAPRVEGVLPEKSCVRKLEHNLPQVVRTLESEIICRGHAADRRELCFGCTVPPRQFKFDIVRQNVVNCFGLCTGSRYKAVCRKCKTPFPTCTFCGKQSVIEHP